MGHDHGQTKENKTIISFKNSFWLVIILVGLFVAALNFVNAESVNEEGKGEGAKTEMPAGEKTETKAEEPKKTEEAKPAETPAAPATDSAKAK